MKDLVALMAKALVDKPEEVVVTEIEGQQIYVIELKVAKEDIGKIIGKQGRTARAIRTILGAAAYSAEIATLFRSYPPPCSGVIRHPVPAHCATSAGVYGRW